MRLLRRAGTLLVAAVVLVMPVAACSTSGDAQGSERAHSGVSVGSSAPPPPPPPPPPIDAPAGSPAYLATVGREVSHHVLLDESGRVVRVMPGDAEIRVPCPGGRRVVNASSYDERVDVRTLGGRLEWRGRIPAATIHGIACLDQQARRVAVVHDHDFNESKSLRLLSRRGARRVMRFVGEVPLLSSDHMYVTNGKGIRALSMPSRRLVRSWPEPPYAHRVLPSPDGRRLGAVAMDGDTLNDRSWLVGDGGAQAVRLPRPNLLGWLDRDRLAVVSGRDLHVLDGNQRSVAVVENFRPRRGLVIDGRVVAIDGTRLVRVRPGEGKPEAVGSVPEHTTLLARL